MGKFQFEAFAPLNPIEQIMRSWVLHARETTDGAAPALDHPGMERLFSSLTETPFLSDFIQRYSGDAESVTRFRDDFDYRGFSDATVADAMRYAALLHSLFFKGESQGQLLSRYDYVTEDKDVSPLGTSFDLRLRRHARYLPIHPHSHDFFELVILVRGICRHMVGNDYLTMQTGDIVVVPPNTVHWMIADDEESLIINMSIRRSSFEQHFMSLLSQRNILGEFFKKMLFAKKDTGSYLLIRTGNYFIEDNYLADIDHELQTQGPYQADILSSLCKLFFLKLLDQYSNQIYLSGASYERYDMVEMMNYIQERKGNVTKKELSEHFSYSERQITRLISQCTGSTLRDLRKHIRMDHAAQLLRTTSLPVEAVATQLGFQDSSHFYTAFRDVFRTTPQSYRDQDAGNRNRLRVDPAYTPAIESAQPHIPNTQKETTP